MLGAVVGDVIGSLYEVNNIKEKDFSLFSNQSRYTDDSVMSCAIAKSCINYYNKKDIEKFRKDVVKNMRELGRLHINAGYGGTFIKWLLTKNPIPYNSWGNGSAMRVSPVAWVSDSIEECEQLAEASSIVSHNHPEGIKGAKAIASAVFMANNGFDKESIKEYIEEKYYDLNFNLDDIRYKYKFDVSCQGSVPQAIKSFLEGNDFEDVIRNAISIGGDSDTIAAMAASIAEAYYGIPNDIADKTNKYLSSDLKQILSDFDSLRVELKKKNFKKR